MSSVRTGPEIGTFAQLLTIAGVAQVALLAVLATGPGLTPAGWLVGLTCGLGLLGLLARAGRRAGTDRLGPASLVTLTRAVLVNGVAALAVTRPTPVPVLVAIAAVALMLDAVDGRVARRTGTASDLGARFDMEVDSFLLLVLSLYVANSMGPWVLAIGAMRYAYVVAMWTLPWLRRPAPPRYWCKVVAAIQGIVLVCAASGLFPALLAAAAVAIALALLVESFGRDAVWLYRHRQAEPNSAQLS